MIKQIKSKLTKKNKRGFTLIELIVVIAIVAILAAIGIPAIAGQVTKSQTSSANSNCKLIAEQASIMLTQAETAGNYAVITKVDGTPLTIASATDANFLAAVAEAANVDLAAYTTLTSIELDPINETDAGGTTVQVGWRVKEVKLEKDNIKGKFPLV